MLRPLPDLPDGVLGFEAVGEVHSDDYRDVLRPAVEAAAAEGKVDLVYVLGPEFTGYSTGAAWQDTRLGLGHISAFERIAVVTDVDWVEHLVSGFGWMVPGELRRFALADRDEAVRWTAGTEAPAQPAVEAAPEPEEPGEGSIAAPLGDPAPMSDEGTPSSPVDGPAPEPAVAVTQPWAVDPLESDAPVPEPVDADPVAPAAFTAVTEPAAADPVEPEPQPVRAEAAATSVTVQPSTPITEPQTLTPHAPFAPGADVRPGMATPAPTPPATPSVPEQWAADPTGRHQHRWWNGTVWTEHVADNGVSSVDPIG